MSEIKPRKLQPIQLKILDVLSDGLPHTKQQLHGCLSDPLVNMSTLTVHISWIREVLRPRGEDIVCELRNRRIHYRHVRLLKSSAEE